MLCALSLIKTLIILFWREQERDRMLCANTLHNLLFYYFLLLVGILVFWKNSLTLTIGLMTFTEPNDYQLDNLPPMIFGLMTFDPMIFGPIEFCPGRISITLNLTSTLTSTLTLTFDHYHPPPHTSPEVTAVYSIL